MRVAPPARYALHHFAPMLAGLIAYGLNACWSWQVTPLDDAYITLRYASHWLMGLGPVFNPGERVEGYSNPLWLLILTGMGWLGFDLVASSRWLGLLLGALVVILTDRFRAAYMELPTGSEGSEASASTPNVLRWMPLWTGAFMPLAYHSVGGLETAAFSVSVLIGCVGFMKVLLHHDAGYDWLTCAGCGAVLLRPDGILLPLLLIGQLWWMAPELPTSTRDIHPLHAKPDITTRRRMCIKTSLIIGACLSLLLLCRYTYYGELLPNTYYVKQATLELTVPLGIHYAAMFLKSYAALFLPAGVTLVLLWIRQPIERHIYRGLIVLCFVFSCYIVSVGGDHFAWYRFFVPLWAPAMFLLAWAIQTLAPRMKSGAQWFETVTGMVFFVYFAVPPAGEIQHSREAMDNVNRWTSLGHDLRKSVSSETVIALSPVGALPYYSDLMTLDILGLTDRHIARRPPDPAIRYVGHYKHDGHYVLERKPDLILLDNARVASHPVTTFPLDEISPMEKDLVQSPLWNEYHIVNIPLSSGLYLVGYARERGTLQHLIVPNHLFAN